MRVDIRFSFRISRTPAKTKASTSGVPAERETAVFADSWIANDYDGPGFGFRLPDQGGGE